VCECTITIGLPDPTAAALAIGIWATNSPGTGSTSSRAYAATWSAHTAGSCPGPIRTAPEVTSERNADS
jgi:hypothetical protein